MNERKNPGNQFSVTKLFDHPKQEYDVQFYHQGCQLFKIYKSSSNMAPLKLEIILEYQEIAENILLTSNFVTDL